MAPTTASRISTAAAVAVARRLVSATPGGSAAGRFACAMARPIRWIVSAGTAVREATDSASKPARMPSSSAGSPPTGRPAELRRFEGHARDAEREDALAAGLRGKPLVRVASGEREPRTHVDQARVAALGRRHLARRLDLAGVLDGREPALERVRAEVDHEIRAFQIEDRAHARAEDRVRRLAQRLVAEGLVVEPAAAASHRGEEAIEERRQRRPQLARERAHPAASGAELLRQQRRRLLPADLLEDPAGAPHARLGVAVRVIGAADARLAERAQRAAVHRVLGISLELDRPALARSHVQAAGRRALEAGRGVVHRLPGSDLLGLHHVRDQLLDVIGAAGRSGAARAHAHQLQEITTIELGHGLPDPSSGR